MKALKWIPLAVVAACIAAGVPLVVMNKTEPVVYDAYIDHVNIKPEDTLDVHSREVARVVGRMSCRVLNMTWAVPDANLKKTLDRAGLHWTDVNKLKRDLEAEIKRRKC